MASTWKPCDHLEPADFVKHPVWTFDPVRASRGGADETWVRPVGYRGFDCVDDELFVRATVTDRDGELVEGAILCARLARFDRVKRRSKPGPFVDGFVLLLPEYRAFAVKGGRLAEKPPPDLRMPLTYDIDVPLVGTKRLTLRGAIAR